MFYLLCFVQLIIGILSYRNLYLLFISLAVFIFVLIRFKWKLSLLNLSFVALGLFITFIQPKGNIKLEDGIFIVIKAEENYIVCLNITGKYYVKANGNDFALFDIIKITGYCEKLSFNHFEEGFNFKTYLQNSNINYELNIKGFSYIFKNFIRKDAFNYCLKYIEYSDAYKYVSNILFKDNLDKSFSYYYEIYENDMSAFVSLSTLNFYFLFKVNVKLAEKLKIKRLYADILNIIISVLFLFFTNFKFSLLKLLILNLFFLFKAIFKFKLETFQFILTMGFVFLILNPYLIYQKSFYISYMIVIFNFLIKPILYKFNYAKRNVIRTLLICLLLLPLSMMENHTISLNRILLQIPLFLFANLIFSLSILLFICPFLGYIVNYLVIFYLSILRLVNRYNLLIIVGDFSLYLCLLYYLLFSFILIFAFLKYKTLFSISIISSILFVSFISLPNISNKYEIHFIDVGQGDATLIRYKRKNILIDTGGSTYNDLSKECLIPYFRKNKIYYLDYVLITHRDFDHYGALENLNKNFKINQIIYNEDFYNLEIDGLNIENLNQNPNYSNDNDNSMVLKFEIKNTSFLIMGDASKTVENSILSKHIDIKSDIIKIGHHGSNTSTSFDFLYKVDPKLAVISCGENNIYKHPSSEVIKLLNNLNIDIVRTDIDFTYVKKL